ncbi:FHA domain-containing protein [Chitinimonas sp.]|uniref:FHA domain-containing protein n=1 Tax=Chitinimonas sp. TaxID=1934313 RepID=UPI002F923F5E
MKLTLLTTDGQTAEPLSAYFDEDGGTLGRAPANTLVLSGDSNISQVHLAIEAINGSWMLKDLGDLLPVFHNGKPLGYGTRAALKDGDRLRIGGFELGVALHATRPAEMAVPGNTAIPAATATTSTAAAQLIDPFDFGDLTRPIAAPAQPLPADSIFDSPLQEPVRASSAALNDVGGSLGSLLGHGGNAPSVTPVGHQGDSLDLLFGLQGGQGADPLAHNNPFESTTPVGDDPFGLNERPVVQATAPDHVPGIHSSMSLAPTPASATQASPAVVATVDVPTPAQSSLAEPEPVAAPTPPSPPPAKHGSESLDELFGLG